MKSKVTLFPLIVLFLVTPAFAQFTRVNQTATTESVLVADMNHDGLDDLLDSKGIHLNLGHGIFAAPFQPWRQPNLTLVGTIDFNGDGLPDLIAQEQNFNIPFNPSNPYAAPVYRLFQNNGPGGFADLGVMDVGLVGRVVDFDGDGKDDIVATRSLGLGNNVQVSFYRSNWNGTFTVSDRHELVGFGSESAPQSGAGIGMAKGDLNGDGIPDLVLRSENEFVFLFGKGGGVFEQVNRYFPNPGGGNALDIVDVDGDGKLDLVFTKATISLVIMFGDGSGHFPRAITYDFPDAGRPQFGGSYAVGKFTGAQPEIAIVTESGNLLTLSAQGGTIKQTSRTAIGLYRGTLFSGRFESPGKRDLLPVGFSQPDGGWDTLEGFVFLTNLQPSPALTTPPPSRRVRASGRRVAPETFNVSISDDCTTYNDQWSLQREGYFYVDANPKPGRTVEAAFLDGSIFFRVTPDGTDKSIPLVREGLIVDTEIGTMAGANGVNPCGRSTVYSVNVTKQ